MGSPDRPYFNYSWVELEQIFKVSKKDRSTLEDLLHELDFRKTLRADTLRNKISDTLKIINSQQQNKLKNISVFINEIDNDLDVVTYFFEYHPYRCGPKRNPDFDENSADILSLKRCNKFAINRFYSMLDPLLNKGIPIASVPPSDPERTMSGIKMLAQKLALNGRIDATDCLCRNIQVQKKSQGGIRDYSVEIGSIIVKNEHLIKGKIVMLLDDVCTSGTSLAACSQLLKDAGAKNIKRVALAQTVRKSNG